MTADYPATFRFEKGNNVKTPLISSIVYDTILSGGETLAKIDKLINKMMRQPKGITFQEVKKALEHAGYIEVRVVGSHHHFRNEQGLLTTVKRINPVHPKAVEDALMRLNKHKGE